MTDPLVLAVSKQSVDELTPELLVSRLESLLATPQSAWRYRRQVVFTFTGFDEDPRALTDVPEVRAYLRKFHSLWPYWAYFFNRVDECCILMMSCHVARAYLGQGKIEVDPAALQHFLLSSFNAMNSVFDRFGFPEEELEAMSSEILELVMQAD